MIVSQHTKSTKYTTYKWYIFFMKTKIFDCETELELEEKINNFLEENELIDLKYQVAIGICGEEQIYCFSALILYR